MKPGHSLVVSKKDAGLILGLSPGRVTQLIQLGLPTTSWGAVIIFPDGIGWYLGQIRWDMTNMVQRQDIKARLETYVANTPLLDFDQCDRILEAEERQEQAREQERAEKERQAWAENEREKKARREATERARKAKAKALREQKGRAVK